MVLMVLTDVCISSSLDIADFDYTRTEKNMPFLGKRSLMNLSEAEWFLQKIVQRAISKRDFSVIDCYRGEAEQNAKHAQGLSKVKWPHSAHNTGDAVDIIPCPFQGWDDKDSFQSVVLAFNEAVGELKKEGELPIEYELEYGIDWEFQDWGHIQKKGY